jgi:hypothetical protein
VYSERSSIAIHVYPDQSVLVEAPLQTELDAIREKVRKCAKWIVKQQRTFEDYQTPEHVHQYVSGEAYYYLGRRYRLKVIQSDVERVKFNRGRIFLYVNDSNDLHSKHDLMQKWYRVRARFIFQERLKICFSRFEGFNIPFPDMKIRAMKSQWGSCTASGKIILNLKLIQVSKKLIDYVIIHELCHLIEHNHSRSFYELLERMLPNWQELRQELNQFEFYVIREI